MSLDADETIQALKAAFRENDSARFRQLLVSHPELETRINDPIAAFESPLIVCVRSREMLDVLLDAGADINARSRWWAGGFVVCIRGRVSTFYISQVFVIRLAITVRRVVAEFLLHVPMRCRMLNVET